MNAVLTLTEEAAAKGVVTHSSGNHAQALALAAKTRGIRANIVMPSNAPQVKKDAVAGYGAVITECEPTNEARSAAAAAVERELGSHFVHPSNDPAVMAGQDTMALELLQQIPQLVQQRAEQQAAALTALGVAVPPPGDAGAPPLARPAGAPLVDAVIVPLGGGGMLSGIAVAVKSIDPRILVVAGEPAGAADAAASVAGGKLQGHATPPSTVADGLRTTLGSNTWPIVQHAVDGILLVSDTEILTGMELLWTRLKVAAEPSAGVGLATLMDVSSLAPCGPPRFKWVDMPKQCTAHVSFRAEAYTGRYATAQRIVDNRCRYVASLGYRDSLCSLARMLSACKLDGSHPCGPRVRAVVFQETTHTQLCICTPYSMPSHQLYCAVSRPCCTAHATSRRTRGQAAWGG